MAMNWHKKVWTKQDDAKLACHNDIIENGAPTYVNPSNARKQPYEEWQMRKAIAHGKVFAFVKTADGVKAIPCCGEKPAVESTECAIARIKAGLAKQEQAKAKARAKAIK